MAMLTDIAAILAHANSAVTYLSIVPLQLFLHCPIRIVPQVGDIVGLLRRISGAAHWPAAAALRTATREPRGLLHQGHDDAAD